MTRRNEAAADDLRRGAQEELTTMAKMTRGEVQDLLSKFATESPKYRAALMANPKSVIERQLNTSLGSVQVKAIAETADTVYVVIPHVPASGELSDADLEKVAGGFKEVDARCDRSGAGSYGASVNTVLQINT